MSKPIYTPFSKEELIPQEERLEVHTQKSDFSIGIPKEEHIQEGRICLTPDAVQVLVANGHKVTVEAGAGLDAKFTDNQYSEAGAKIAYGKEEVFSQPIVVKVEPPSEEESNLLKPNSFLISAVQPGILDKDYFETLAKKRITAIGLEYIEDQHGFRPIVRLISEIAGNAAILIAGELLSTTNGGNGIMLGGVAGVRPASVVILGAGTVGEYAARAALGFGADVRVFDNSLTKLIRLQNCVNNRISTSIIDPKEVEKALRRCDIAIGAIRGNDRAPIIVTENIVRQMKAGSIILDISIDTGGCFETSEVTTHENPTFIKHNVVHYGVTNITSRYARTSSKALSNYFMSYLLKVGEEGGFDCLLSKDKGLRRGVYMYKGRHTNQQLSKWFNLKYQDINLLII